MSGKPFNKENSSAELAATGKAFTKTKRSADLLQPESLGNKKNDPARSTIKQKVAIRDKPPQGLL